MATIGTTGSGTIVRTPQDVWDFIVGPAFLHHWVKDIEPGGTWLDGETPGAVGSRYRVDYSCDRRTNEIVFEIPASDSPVRLAVNTVSGPYPITADYTLITSVDGTSPHVEFEMIVRLDSRFTATMFILTGWFASWFMKRQLKKELIDLQRAMSSQQT